MYLMIKPKLTFLSLQFFIKHLDILLAHFGAKRNAVAVCVNEYASILHVQFYNDGHVNFCPVTPARMVMFLLAPLKYDRKEGIFFITLKFILSFVVVIFLTRPRLFSGFSFCHWFHCPDRTLFVVFTNPSVFK